MYGLLLEAGWHTLNSFGNSPKWLGARTAATIVLHTWGQNLSLFLRRFCLHYLSRGITGSCRRIFEKCVVTIETLEANKSPPVHLWPLFYN